MPELDEKHNRSLTEAAQRYYQLQLQAMSHGQAHSYGADDAFSAINNEMYRSQIAALEATGTHWKGFHNLAAFQDLLTMIRAESCRYMQACGCPEEQASMLSSESQLVVWCSVHANNSAHPNHVHTEAMLSGVYYTAVPPASGDLIFEDPRGMQPFGLEKQQHVTAPSPFHRPHTEAPCVGRLLIFPPWLVHRVEPSGSLKSARVSFSFNLLGAWGSAYTSQYSPATPLPADTSEHAELSESDGSLEKPLKRKA